MIENEKNDSAEPNDRLHAATLCDRAALLLHRLDLEGALAASEEAEGIFRGLEDQSGSAGPLALEAIILFDPETSKARSRPPKRQRGSSAGSGIRVGLPGC